MNMPITLEALARQVCELADLEAVRTLMVRYHRACDGTIATGTHRDPQAIANLFTSDGEWHIPGGTIAGREAIAATARNLQAIPGIVHVVVNPFIEIAGDTARGEFKGFVRAQFAEKTAPLLSVGLYTLVAERTPNGWLIRSLGWDYLETPADNDEIGEVLNVEQSV